MIDFFDITSPDLTIKFLKIKEAGWARDEKLFEHSEFFSSVAGDSVVFSQNFIGSLDFFDSFLCQDKNEHIHNQRIHKEIINRTQICEV